ncbi:MAG TPA: transketolase C-terminal domain-containing protein [Alphaproteobacteria bacterium]|nr:transketolase C-terminal domain-containing protein [Alphaproteobacteria bacterium]
MSQSSSQMNFAEAIIDALCVAMDNDPKVSIIGRGISGHGAEAGADKRLAPYGDRVLDPPTSEAAVAMLSLGASMSGLRMFHHFGSGVFAFEAWNQVVNEAANARYMSGGRLKSPVTYCMFHGLRNGGGPQHSASLHGGYAHNPGLEVVMPATPADAKGLVLTSLYSDNATVMLVHPTLLALRADVPGGDYRVPFGKAAVHKQGKDVTIVAISRQVTEALKAADMLAKDGISAEVVDPRTLVPLDEAGLLASVAKTGRVVVADEGPNFGSASEIAAVIAEKGFKSLKAPIMRVNRPHTPVPFSPDMEAFMTPDAEKIAAAARRTLAA